MKLGLNFSYAVIVGSGRISGGGGAGGGGCTSSRHPSREVPIRPFPSRRALCSALHHVNFAVDR